MEKEMPREKFMRLGIQSLSNVELFALIIGNGTRRFGVMQLADRLNKLCYDMENFPSFQELSRIAGIGKAKSAKIVAAFELGRRFHKNSGKGRRITKAEDILPYLQEFADRKQEYFICFTLNGANEIIKRRVITIGLVDRCQVHPREVFADAITDRAASVILAHNHPSGDTCISSQDEVVTEKMIESANILGIRVLDHIVVAANGGYRSFQEQGLIPG